MIKLGIPKRILVFFGYNERTRLFLNEFPHSLKMFYIEKVKKNSLIFLAYLAFHLEAKSFRPHICYVLEHH